MPKRVLITGAAGAIGRCLVTTFTQHGYTVTGLDRKSGPAGVAWFTGSLQDSVLVSQAVANQDAIVHLGGTPDQADFVSDLLPNNVAGTYILLSAAQAAGITRVAMASTLRVMALHRNADGTSHTDTDTPCPHDEYSLSKVMCEDMARFFCQRHKFTIMCARIGWFLRNANEHAVFYNHAHRRGGADHISYLSHDDCAEFFIRAIEAEIIGFSVFTVTSKRIGFEALQAACTAAIGWAPRDTYPQGTPAEVLQPPAAESRP